MTKARDWPNKAKWARDDTAYLLQEIIREARGLLKSRDDRVAATAGRIISHATRGRAYLREVGAEVREDEL